MSFFKKAFSKEKEKEPFKLPPGVTLASGSNNTPPKAVAPSSLGGGGGMDSLFAGMSLKTEPAAPAAVQDAPSAGARASSAFGFMAAAPNSSQPPSNNGGGGSAFGFVSASSSAAPAEPSLPIPSKFAFIAPSGSSEELPQPSEPTPASGSAFSFLSAQQQLQDPAAPEVQSSSSSAFSFVASQNANAEPAQSENVEPEQPAARPAAAVKPARKKGGFVRPGFARGNDEDAPPAAPQPAPVQQQQPQPQTPERQSASSLTALPASVPSSLTALPPTLSSSPAPASAQPAPAQQAPQPQKAFTRPEPAPVVQEQPRVVEEPVQQRYEPVQQQHYEEQPVEEDEDSEDIDFSSMEVRQRSNHQQQQQQQAAGEPQPAPVAIVSGLDLLDSLDTGSVPAPVEAPAPAAASSSSSVSGRPFRINASSSSSLSSARQAISSSSASSVSRSSSSSKLQSSPAPQPQPPQPQPQPLPANEAESWRVLLSRSQSDLAAVREELKRCDWERRNASLMRRNYNVQLNKAYAKLKECEQLQNEASEREDFERAEELNQEIEAIHIDLGRVKERIDECESTHRQLEGQSDDLQRRCISLYERFMAQFKDLKSEQELTLSDFKSECNEKLVSEKDRLTDESERLSRQQKLIELDSKDLEHRKSRFEDRINEQTRDVQTVKSEQEAIKDRLEREIEDLERQIEEKRKDLQKAVRAIDEADTKISRVKSVFTKELMRLESEDQFIQQRMIKCNEDRLSLESAQQSYQREVKRVQSEEERRKKTIDDIIVRMQEYQDTVFKLKREEKVSLDQKEAKSRLLERDRKDEAELESLRERLAVQNTEMVEQAAAIIRLQAEAATLRQSISHTDQRLPELDKDKKLAVTSRNFKAAQTINAEITALKEQRESDAVRLDGTLASIARTEEDHESIRRHVSNLERDLKSREKACDGNRLLQLLKEMMKLEHTIKVEATGDDMSRAELDACRVEASDIKSRHVFGADELMRLESQARSEVEKERAAVEEARRPPVPPSVAAAARTQRRLSNASSPSSPAPSSPVSAVVVPAAPSAAVAASPASSSPDLSDFSEQQQPLSSSSSSNLLNVEDSSSPFDEVEESEALVAEEDPFSAEQSEPSPLPSHEDVSSAPSMDLLSMLNSSSTPASSGFNFLSSNNDAVVEEEQHYEQDLGHDEEHQEEEVFAELPPQEPQLTREDIETRLLAFRSLVSELQSEMDRLNGLVDEAAASEDYDRADEYQSQMVSLSKELGAAESQAREAEELLASM